MSYTPSKTPRVRIAPSPTGNLHIGTARTALFNYLFAKRFGGQFILRIEDTDLERSEKQYEEDIFKGLKALGLNWDEGPDVGGGYGPYRQTERLENYRAHAQKLLDEGKAYYCYKTADELESEREAAKAQNKPYVYVRPNYSVEELDALKNDPSRQPSIRFKIPDGLKTVVFDDIIRGEISFETELIGDFVLMKSNGTPTYNFACVVDDALMAITEIIRGEDHISNTPKQIMIFDALEFEKPRFAHVGMILAPDRTKLSKRQGATGIAEFRVQGYLPEALCNFLALLGWAPPEGKDIGTLEEFSMLFDLSKVAHSPAIFDKDKLNFLNSHAIRQVPLNQFEALVAPYLSEYDLSRYSQAQKELIWQSVREPLIVLSEITDAVSYFFNAPSQLQPEAQETLFKEPHVAASILENFKQEVLQPNNFETLEQLTSVLKPFAKAQEPHKMKTVMWTLRSAITGRVHGAELSNIIFILGQAEVLKRVENALAKITAKV